MAARSIAALAALLLLVPATAGAVVVRDRTVRVSAAPAGDADGASARPALSASGLLVAFESTATDLAPDGNGPVRDVFLRDVVAGTTAILSTGHGGLPADGPSGHPAIAGRRVAFVSDATNLVPGDTNGRRDVFVRDAAGDAVRVSVASDGTQADGDSGPPDISADGRLVVFSSAATNLVPNDVNGVADVFVHDLQTRATRIVTRILGVQADGPSHAPAISPDGRFVTFASTASRFVTGDVAGTQDVFLHDRLLGSTERVSVSTDGVPQNRSVAAGFHQVSDVSAGGRYVVFDSDADNLVRGDRNRDTDVFLRDRVQNTTTRVSRAPSGEEGDNDSYHPSITPDARLVAFTSFAGNLAPGDAPGEDVFAYDRRMRAATVIGVPSRGGARGAESARQLLQRAALSDDGSLAAFTSTAGNLVEGDRAGLQDVFLRVLAAPSTSWRRRPARRTRSRRPRYAARADDPAAGPFLCRVAGRRFTCPARGRLPRLARGRHRLEVHAGGPGLLFDRSPVRRSFRIRR